MPLPPPTIELIRAEGEKFDLENATTEAAIRDLVGHFPNNTYPAGVLLKAAAINQLYKTNVFAIEKLASHIVALGIDPLLTAGAPEAVCRIEILNSAK